MPFVNPTPTTRRDDDWDGSSAVRAAVIVSHYTTRALRYLPWAFAIAATAELIRLIIAGDRTAILNAAGIFAIPVMWGSIILAKWGRPLRDTLDAKAPDLILFGAGLLLTLLGGLYAFRDSGGSMARLGFYGFVIGGTVTVRAVDGQDGPISRTLGAATDIALLVIGVFVTVIAIAVVLKNQGGPST